MHEINSLVQACREIGNDPQLIQTSGGNISVKLDQDFMLIKASGIFLKDVSAGRGYVKIKYQNIKQHIESLKETSFSSELEQRYNQILIQNTVDSESRPSLETGFHTILGKSVIHTHPVLVSTITCSNNGAKILKEIFPDDNFLWVPYAAPGAMLSKEILDVLKKNKVNVSDNLWIFLENHGLIVSSDSLDKCIGDIKLIVDKVRSYLLSKNVELYNYETFDFDMMNAKRIKSGILQILLEKNENKKLFEKHMFPDSVVFCGGGFTFNKPNKEKISLYDDGTIELPEISQISSVSIIETLMSVIYILLLIEQFDSPKFIGEAEENNIKKMKSEKHRQKANEEK